MYPRVSGLQKQEDAQPLGTLQRGTILTVVHNIFANISESLFQQWLLLQLFSADSFTAVSARAAMQRSQSRPSSLPTPYEEGFLDITDYRFMEEVEDPYNDQLGPECTGIVLHSLFGGADQVLSALHTLCFRQSP